MKKWKEYILMFIFIVLGATIIGRLIFLQIKKNNFYLALAEGQQKIIKPIQGERGEIFFANGDPLAANKQEKYVFVSPRTIKNKSEVAEKLSLILKMEKEEIEEALSKNNYFAALKYDLSKEKVEEIEKANLTGVYVEEKNTRFYPQGETAANVIGFVGGENTGQYGIEGYCQEILEGKETLIQKSGAPFEFLSEQENNQGKGTNVQSTLDPNIQFTAEEMLKEAHEEYKFKNGQVIVLDPRSGEVLAMAHYPSFNPNEYSKVENTWVFQNNAVQIAYEPGSVFKAFTMAAALNEKRVTPETEYVDTGKVEVGSWTIRNYDQNVWGRQTMTNVLEKSINTGAVFAERQLGHKKFWDYIERFGFLEKTGIAVQGELLPQNKEIKSGREISFLTASFGQGIEVTPIQLAQAFSVFANNGKMTPVKIIKDTDPKTNDFFPPRKEERVISQETAQQMTNMLTSVVETGFAKSAQIKGYHVAGKTGTAQMPWPALGVDRKGYSEETAQTFVGFAPSYDPRFLIVVKLDAPQTRTAGYSAVPIFHNLAKYILDYWEIPPTKTEDLK